MRQNARGSLQSLWLLALPSSYVARERRCLQRKHSPPPPIPGSRWSSKRSKRRGQRALSMGDALSAGRYAGAHAVWRHRPLVPGERFWKQAQTCRRQSGRIRNKPDPTVSEAMAETASAMSNALRSALSLADRATEQSALTSERRVQGPACPDGQESACPPALPSAGE